MTKSHNQRPGCKDVFHASMLENARFDGKLEFPWLKPEQIIPNRMIPYSKAKYSKDTDQWVIFFEDDVKFESDTWDHPQIALEIIKRFRGAIAPDYSMFRDMPLIQQQWNNFRSKTIAHYWQSKGIQVLPNNRWADRRTWDIACLGVPRCSSIVLGTLGCVKDTANRQILEEGLRYIVWRLSPTSITIYGTAPSDIFQQYKDQGIKLNRVPSECEIIHQKENR